MDHFNFSSQLMIIYQNVSLFFAMRNNLKGPARWIAIGSTFAKASTGKQHSITSISSLKPDLLKQVIKYMLHRQIEHNYIALFC